MVLFLSETGATLYAHAPGVIVTGAAVIDKEIIDIGRANGLRGIVKAGAGLDNVDVAHARAADVVVANVPAYAAESVAEYAVTFMLALVRKLWPLQRAMRRDGWVDATSAWQGSELNGKTIGLIGFGHTGKRVARITHFGFQMPVLAFDPHVDAQEMAAVGVQKANDLAQLFSQSDIVSIHCELNPATANMVEAQLLRVMKPSALFINVARGGIVGEAALAAALLEGRIGGAALDVFSKEPLEITAHPLFSRLAEMENVLLSSHLAWHTAEAGERLQREVSMRCRDMIKVGIR